MTFVNAIPTMDGILKRNFLAGMDIDSPVHLPRNFSCLLSPILLVFSIKFVLSLELQVKGREEKLPASASCSSKLNDAKIQ